jgi:hypothetical protein
MMFRKIALALWIAGAWVAAAAQMPAMGQQKTRSYEGMWIPLNAREVNYADMQSLGLQLKAHEVYSDSLASVKDAIVRLNNGSCTAEAVSPEGLLFTNHHCAYDGIAALSTPEKDYLTDGFWAMSRGEELPIPGGTAAFLISSRNVTQEVLEAANQDEAIESLIAAATDGKGYEATVEEMFNGLEYYLFVYEVYTDVRLVGAPPSAIGKFGGDTDNWMWPRHTGDFSVLRVYAGADNRPADYSPDNKPYQPKHYLPISLKGIQENDYAMVMGYPGSTERYLTASAIDLNLSQSNPDRIKLLGMKTTLMKQAMDQDDAVRINLASEYASLMNYYKYLIGQTTMLQRYKIADVKRADEAKFQAWAEADSARKSQYGELLANMAKLYERYRSTDRLLNYLQFAGLASEATAFSFQGLNQMRGALASGDQEAVKGVAAELGERGEEYFKKYNAALDKEILVQGFLMYYQDLPADQRPPVLEEVLAPKSAAPAEEEEPKKKKKKKKASSEEMPALPAAEMSLEQRVRKWADEAFAASLATDKARFDAFIANPTQEALENDPLLAYAGGLITHFRSKGALGFRVFNQQSSELYRDYMEALQKMQPDRDFYPDANSTLRLTYGKVLPYYPRDGVFYKHYTTLEGVIEKEDPSNPDEFTVPAKLKELHRNKDFGSYAQDGSVPVCFLTTNDITGGNSGSPVINARGELIGCAFDGNWEAMAGDIYVFPELNRTICVDARYILFIIEKYAGAGHLLKEMKIVR